MGPSEKTVKRLFALSRNRCAFAGCSTAIVHSTGTIVGAICHIEACGSAGPRHNPKLSEEKLHAFENLLVLCNVHHKIVDDQAATFTVDLLRDMKAMHERNGDIELSQEAARMATSLFKQTQVSIYAHNSNVISNSPGAIQAETFVIKTTRKTVPPVVPTHGAIGNDLAKRNYTLHLIERYNDFQKWDSSKEGRGKYMMIYRAI